jgi:pantothenate kinase, type III
MTTILLLDVGNSRLKWALHRDGALLPGAALLHDGDPAAALASVALPPVEAVWVADVTDAAMRARLAASLTVRCGVAPQFAHSEASFGDLVNAYAEPRRLGVDRWLALIAARARVAGAPLCVVGAGTALTVDLVAADGRHLGGIIAPGFEAMRRALRDSVRFSVDFERLPEARDRPAGDSADAVAEGLLLPSLAVIERLAARLPGAVGLLHGGDAPRLLPHLGAGWQHAPDSSSRASSTATTKSCLTRFLWWAFADSGHAVPRGRVERCPGAIYCPSRLPCGIFRGPTWIRRLREAGASAVRIASLSSTPRSPTCGSRISTSTPFSRTGRCHPAASNRRSPGRPFSPVRHWRCRAAVGCRRPSRRRWCTAWSVTR